MNPYLGEFLGTLLLILLGEGVVAGVVLKGTKAENAGWLTVCIAWGLRLPWVFMRWASLRALILIRLSQ